MILLLAIAGVVIAKVHEPRKPDGLKTGQNDTGMDELRKLFYFGMSEQQLIQMLTKDAELVGIGTSDQLDADHWLTLKNIPIQGATTLQNDPMYWLLIAKLRLRENATDQASDGALKALSLTSDPSFSHWAWRLLRNVGHTPVPAEKDQLLGVAFEHWVPGTPKGWAMVCTYNDAAPRLYLSWSAGMIGNVTFPGVREKAERFLSEAIAVIGRMSITEEPSLPKQKEMAIYVLTPGGIRVAMESEDNIHNGNGPFAPVGFAAADLIEKLMEAYKASQAR